MSTPRAAEARRRLPIWAFLVMVIVYLAIIQGVGRLVGGWVDSVDGEIVDVEQVLVLFWIPLGAALVFTYGVVAWLGWWREVLHEDKRVQRWVWFVPAAFLVAVVLGTDYSQLADNGLAFTVVLLIGTQFVGWGEEGMFRGVGVTVLRATGLTEGKVALWSSLIFGAVHLSNALGRGTGAVPQALAVSFAGYFFYLVRRVSGGNVLNSVLHGLFDFSILSSSAIAVDQDIYIGSAVPILVYPVVGIVLLVRRRRIELPRAPSSRASSQ